MGLSWLELQGLRSYDRLHWEPDPSVNILVGPNGVGKTNLLEAVGYLASLKSFRRAVDSVLIKTGYEQAAIRGEAVHTQGQSLIEIELRLAGRRQALLNRTRLTRISNLLGSIRTVTFLPDDLDIVKRSPSYRRDFLDTTAVQIWPVSFQDQQDYERILRQRNSLLRQMGRYTDSASLDAWDERLSQAGSIMVNRRLSVVAALEQETALMYKKLSNEDVDVRLEYQAGWAPSRQAAGSLHPEFPSPNTLTLNGDWAPILHQALANARQTDMDRRVSTEGPHRDDLVVWLDGRNVRTHASQGEQRTMVLALRLASHKAVREQVGPEPVLLLDDVFSELDLGRASALAEVLPPGQTFITTARYEEVPLSGRQWQVGEGTVT